METKTPAPTSVNVTAVITPEAKNPPAIVAKPIPARAAPIIVSWDDDMESKRGKLEEVIAQERQNKEQKKTDIDTVLFSRPAGMHAQRMILCASHTFTHSHIIGSLAKWDESAPTITTVTPTTTTTKKFKRPTLLDAEYDCGKVKKRRTSNWQVFDHQRSEGNPFTKFQQHVRDAKQRVKSKSFFKAARRKVE